MQSSHLNLELFATNFLLLKVEAVQKAVQQEMMKEF